MGDGVLISIIVIATALLSAGLTLLIDQYYNQALLLKEKNKVQNYINSLVALNLSHLHDAANFFALLKSSIHNQDTENSYNFAKGAAFHFQSLFEELKNNLIAFENSNGNFDFYKNFDLLYKRETIDLKDLLELELFQLSNFNRIKFSNCTNNEHALISGNFNLVSKALINLIENALKYTEDEIKIELKDRSRDWQIRISSFGKSLPQEVVNKLKNASFQKTDGHGLSGLSSIMLFHQGKIEIDTFAGEGSSINLLFPKLININDSLDKKQMIKTTNTRNKATIVIICLLLVSAILFIIGFYYFKTDSKTIKLEEVETLPNTKKEFKKLKIGLKGPKKISSHKALAVKVEAANNNGNKLIYLIEKQDEKLGLGFDF